MFTFQQVHARTGYGLRPVSNRMNQLPFVPVSCLQPHVSNRGQSGKFRSSFHVKNVKSFTHSHTKISCAKFVSRENLCHSLQAMKSESHRRRPILLWNRYVPTVRGGRGVIQMYRLSEGSKGGRRGHGQLRISEGAWTCHRSVP